MGLRSVVVVFGALVVVSAGGTLGPTVTLGPAGPSHHALSLQTRVPPTPAADPSVVPQAIRRRGQQGYNIVPASQFRPISPSSSAGQPVFRGGRSSKVPTATIPAAPRSTLTLSSPRIAVSPGLDKTGMTAGGFGFTPPDSTGAIGPNNYVEMVNSRITVYDRSLNVVSTSTLQSFIGQAAGVPLCDPQIQWDPAANRWLYSFLYCNTTTSTPQLVLFGWSKTPDPHDLSFNAGMPGSSNAWCQFAFDDAHYLLDFQKLGHNSNYLIVGGNLYDANISAANPPFVSAGIEWAQLPPSPTDQSCAPPASSGGNALPLKNGNGVTYTFTPVPVNTDSAAANGYILSAYDPSGSNGQTASPKSRVAVWHLDSAGVLHADSDVVVNPYDTPSSARQPGSTDVLDTLPGMFTQAVGDPSTGIYTQHTVAGPAGPGGRSEVDWYEFTASGSNLVLAQQGSITDPTDWVFNAAISPRFDGLGAAIEYNRSSQNTYTLIAAQIRYQATAPGSMAAGELVIGHGVGADEDFSCNNPAGAPCRWGDYSGATPDPNPSTPYLVWGTNEVNTSVGPSPSWNDVNFVIAPTPEAPTNVRALSVRPSAVKVSWTPAASDPLFPAMSYTVTADIGGPGGAVAAMTVAAPATTANFTGLTAGVTYVFTVLANSAAGPSLESAVSNAVIPGDPASQSTAGPPQPRSGVNQSTPASPPHR
jgi:hypothetical protein